MVGPETTYQQPCSSLASEHRLLSQLIFVSGGTCKFIDHILPTGYGALASIASTPWGRARADTTLAEMAMNVRMEVMFFMMMDGNSMSVKLVKVYG